MFQCAGSLFTVTFLTVPPQTDVQKILRNARKLPDKTQTFYKVCLKETFCWMNCSKFSQCNACCFLFVCFSGTWQELNRLRKAALAFGFWELLKGVADLLERECTLLPDSAHPDAAFQLSHAAQQLKLASTGDPQFAGYDHNIIPMHTDFSGWVGKHGPQPVWAKEVAPVCARDGNSTPSDSFMNIMWI